MRLDKWLHVAQIFKTRSRSTRACVAGRVRVNGLVAKAHRTVVLEDRLEIRRDNWKQVLIVKAFHRKSLPKVEARRLYRDESEPRPVADPFGPVGRGSILVRKRGRGRPTKRDRRRLHRLKSSSD